MIAIQPSPAPLPMPSLDPGSLRQRFVALGEALTSADAGFEAGHREHRVPAQGASATLRDLAKRLDAARMGLATLQPGSELVARLGDDVISVAADSGTLDIMGAQKLAFGIGWTQSLDRSIADVREAVSLLGAPAPGPAPVPGTPPVTPAPGVPGLRADLERAAALVQRSIETIRTVPATDTGNEETKATRIAAYKVNLEAQAVIERHFTSSDAAFGARLRSADAYLEDANWQLAKKPSPDGRFTGVDIPGALRDSQSAVDLLQQLAAAA